MVLSRCVKRITIGRGSGVYSPPARERFCFFNLHKVVSEAILDHFSRFVNTSLQLHMHAMPGGGGGMVGGNWVTKVGGEQILLINHGISDSSSRAFWLSV